MNFDEVMISNEQPLFWRIFNEVSDRAGKTLTRVRCFAVTRCLSCFESKGRDENAEESVFSLPQDVSFPVRLARAVADAARTFMFDPVAFIRAIASGRTISQERQRRVGTVVAVMVYAAALLIMYGSYFISRQNQATIEPKKQIEVTLLAVPPVIAVRPTPVKQAGGGKNQLTSTKQSIEQPKPEVMRATPEPRPLDHLQSNPEPAQIARGAAMLEQSVSSAGGGIGGGTGSGHGTGIGSGSGAGIASSESVDYNSVFSVANVTVKPQIVGRPIPAYTDEARRNQIEGSVKISVVLKADGTLSDIKVVRGLGYGLDERAIEAARQLRFVPAQKNGHAVSARIALEFRFSLL